jgi:aminoglycoside phosphotransferase (APT) family kinase protein
MPGGAFRVGDTIRRPARPWSASVQALLLHLQQAGTTGVPRPLGFDELGRETVSYVEGQVWNDPLPELVWRESTLLAAAALLRGLHDATVGFRPPANARWMLAMPADLPVEVVCHNDFAPYNLVFAEDRAVGVIDWETSAPGARVWDVAYAAYRFVPLSRDAPPSLLDARVQARRLAAFCGAYGLGEPDRAVLLATVARRVSALRELILARAASGDPPFAAALAQGHAEHYAADLAHLANSASALGECL